jgi:hypothetical protein
MSDLFSKQNASKVASRLGQKSSPKEKYGAIAEIPRKTASLLVSRSDRVAEEHRREIRRKNGLRSDSWPSCSDSSFVSSR